MLHVMKWLREHSLNQNVQCIARRKAENSLIIDFPSKYVLASMETMGLVKKKRKEKKINDFVNCIQEFIYLFVLWCRYAEDLVYLQCFSAVLCAPGVILAACIRINTQ